MPITSARAGIGRLFTIGYQGRSIDDYMDLLAGSRVKVLCDVRQNPISRKPGFSKSRLRASCRARGIDYRHFPDLGVDPARRRQLDSDEAYASLFRFYRLKTLKSAAGCLAEIFSLLEGRGNLAITCFEADPGRCHRSCIAASIQKDHALAEAVNL